MTRLAILASLLLLVFPIVASGQGLVQNPGFETPENTAPWSTPENLFGPWKGDRAETTGQENGIVPAAGDGMLRFDGTKPPGDGGADTGSEVGQLIDLSAYRTEIDNGSVVVDASALFNRVPGDAGTDTQFAVRIGALAGPPSGVPDDEWIGLSENSFFSDGDPATWEMLQTSLKLPPNTDRVALMLVAYENISPTGSPEFDGHYADNASLLVSVVPEPSTLALLGMGAAGFVFFAGRRRRRRSA